MSMMSPRSFLIELRGGHVDGQRVLVDRLPPMWLVLVPRVPTIQDYWSASIEPMELAPITAEYWRTDSQTADGAHVFELSSRG